MKTIVLIDITTKAAHRVLETAAPNVFEYKYLDAGFNCFKRTGNALPEDTLSFVRDEARGALFGATQ